MPEAESALATRDRLEMVTFCPRFLLSHLLSFRMPVLSFKNALGAQQPHMTGRWSTNRNQLINTSQGGRKGTGS